MTYIGRFAPSPTGPLHLGSLVAALGSYLDARANKGLWLLRIEDIDPPREIEGAKALIPQQLEAHGLYWDQSITYQSQRLATYEEWLQTLINEGQAYQCDCSRQRIKSIGGIYDNHCRDRSFNKNDETAIRVKLDDAIQWTDLIQGSQIFSPNDLNGDFILKRRDGLISYQHAVAIDDATQSITHVIRGADLLDSTAKQLHLQKLLGLKSPQYGHLPIVKNSQGQKLSKQTHALELQSDRASESLFIALNCLGQKTDKALKNASPEEILNWAINHWQMSAISKQILNLNAELC